jgi:pyridoxine 5-phosphate synthase
MRLYVNVDHVATVREARRTDEPDPVRAAILAELGGAHGITVHLREDRRHVQERDVRILMDVVRTGVNLELAADSDIVAMACEWKPLQVTLVPERREEVTTEGGLNLGSGPARASLEKTMSRLAGAGIRISLFIDPTAESVRASSGMGAQAVELHTGEYANAPGEAKGTQLRRLRAAACAAREAGLAVHAGHGLTYHNVVPIAAIPEIEELNIGHSIVARAVLVGMERAVREMGQIMAGAPALAAPPGEWLPPVGF